MELGNALFGNSFGNFQIPRGGGWEEEIRRLFLVINDGYGNYCPLGSYSNGTFSINDYYWGECTCGYDDKEYLFCESHKHSEDCFQNRYKAISEYSTVPHNREIREWIENTLKPMYQEYGLDTTKEDWWHGCANTCTCEYKALWAEFVSKNKHDPDCPVVRPNFFYKPTRLEIRWYKYPFRDSYMSQEVSLADFRAIIDDCIDSIKRNK